MIWYAFLALSAVDTPPAPAPGVIAAAQQADASLLRLVTDFIDAERRYDQAKLAALITSDYAEVSPLGDLDRQDAFLGFYAADRKQDLPAMTVGDVLTRRYGDAASIIVRLSFDVPGAAGDPPRTVSMRASFLAVRQGGAWKLASAHYTPERPKPAAPKG